MDSKRAQVVVVTNEAEARMALELALAYMDEATRIMEPVKRAKPATDLFRHYRDSAGAALDGLRPEIELLRADLATQH